VSATDRSRPTVVAHYLPRFYPIPESASAAGPGFTDWRLVAGAPALYPGHDQPRRPADLGYGDLRVAEVRLAQADLARAYGVDAFCYSHHWSLGQRLFERPFAEVLASGEPDFPFCLCWANEALPELDFSQAYSPADDLAHAAFLAEAFADRRYLKVDGRPVLAIRRPEDLADAAATFSAIRAAALRRGAGDPLLVGAVRERGARELPATGLDALLDWPRAVSSAEAGDPGERRPASSRLSLAASCRSWRSRARVTLARRPAGARFPTVASRVHSSAGTTRRSAAGAGPSSTSARRTSSSASSRRRWCGRRNGGARSAWSSSTPGTPGWRVPRSSPTNVSGAPTWPPSRWPASRPGPSHAYQRSR
jgi:hypothetical protein